MGIKDRLETLSRGELVGLVVVIVVTVAGAGFWYVRSLPKPVAIAAGAIAPPAAPGSTAPMAPGSASPAGAPIIVDVTGWVHEPGVYEFSTGDRVIDAVERAGGARSGADLTVLNLAAPLTDGTQVVVPKQGAGGPAAIAPGATGTGGTGTPGTTVVNVNTASATELETLSGIGEVLAAAIVDYRTENGPFASVDDLESVSGIGPSTLEELRDQVTI
ncbi:MAG TPA: ComEA family DNA-binding protein [Actinomycetota bacterium]|nr:ComEA family DNA-binding protein [Actinomycetota bacterium]